MPFPFADVSAEPLADLLSLSRRSVRLDASAVMPVMAQSLIGRTGTPDDIASVVLFCASDTSAIMTGSTLLADAGQTI